MMKIWPWSRIRALEKECDALMNDATELMFNRLVIENGQMEATIENKLMTKMLAEWSRQVFAQYHEAKNYMSIQYRYDDAGNGKPMECELIIQKTEGKTPAQRVAELQEEIRQLRRSDAS